MSSCWKCCQWATLNHQPLWGQPLCNDPSRWRYKDLVIGRVRTTLDSHLLFRAPMGTSKVTWPVFQLNFFLCSIPSDSTSGDITGAPNKHPSTKLYLSASQRTNQQPVSKKIPVFGEDFYLTIIGYLHTCNILKSQNRIQRDGNKDFVCRVVPLVQNS